ncbi:MAG: MFS transporter [Mesorhizobium sp.]|nr:MFS transporter [Mesorhizobium sp.]
MSEPARSPDHEFHPERWIALAALLFAGFMNLIDVTIVNVALPSLQANLGATSTQIEWVVAAYILAFALGLLPFGRLGDRVGRKRIFLLGVAGFTLFSALCGLAPTIGTLIVARVLQGLAGAMMMPQVLAIVQVAFPPNERGLAFSLFGLTAGLASVTGPLAGGLLIEADLGGLDWRPIFLVNIPIGIAVILGGRRYVPALAGNPALRNDWGGMLIAAVSIFLLVFPLIEGRTYGWPLWAFASIAASAAGFAAFYVYEASRARRGLSEILPVALLRNGNFVVGVLLTTIFFSGVAGFFMVLAVFLQSGFGFTPLESGLTTVPFPLGVLIASVLSGRANGRWPKQRLVLGSLVLVAGMLALQVVVSGVHDEVDHWLFVAPLLACGFGMGVGISSLFQTVLAGVPARDAGSGSGALQSFQQIGAGVGVALCGQIFFSTVATELAGGAAQHPSFVAGMQNALIYEAAAFLLAALLVVFLKAPPSFAAQSGARPPHAAPVEV